MCINKILTLILLIFFVQPVHSEEFLLLAGHAFNSKLGTWEKNQSFHIKNGRIIDLNPKLKHPNLPILDFQKFYVVPGLVDAHTHLLLEDPTFGKDFARGMLDFVKNSSDLQRIALAQKRSKSLVDYGFTSVRDLGNDGGITLNHDFRVHFFTSGKGYTPRFGQFPVGTHKHIIQKEYITLDGDPKKELLAHKFQILKIYADEEPNQILTDPVVLKSWVTEGHMLELKVAVHAIFPKAIQAALDAQADTLEHGTYLSNTQMDQMLKQGTIWLPSTGMKVLSGANLYKFATGNLQNDLGQLCLKIQTAHRKGVKIAFGSDNYFSLERHGISFGKATLEALAFLNQCGLSAADVIRSATIIAAEAIGDKAIGSLSIGSYADFNVYKEDPLKNALVLAKPLKTFISGQEMSKILKSLGGK